MGGKRNGSWRMEVKSANKKNYCDADGKCSLFCSNIPEYECSGFTPDLRVQTVRCLHGVGNICSKHFAKKSMDKIVRQIKQARDEAKSEVSDED